MPDVVRLSYVSAVGYHWKPSHALTRTPTGWVMHDGRTLVSRIEKVHIRHRDALHAVSPEGWTITYGPPNDVDFIATAVWVLWERATTRTAPAATDEGRS